MTQTRISSLFLIGLLSVVGLSSTSMAQPKPRYRLIDLGTFGGPNSSVGGQSVVVTNSRSVAGGPTHQFPILTPLSVLTEGALSNMHSWRIPEP
jgi:hypothetical protein